MMGLLELLKSIKMKKPDNLFLSFKNKENKKESKEHAVDSIETRLDKRAASCLDWLNDNSDKDSHRTDYDTLFLSGYSMLKGSKRIEYLSITTLVLSVVLLICTFAMMGMAYLEIPEYPMTGQSAEPISSETYIDMGTNLVHESEYSIKLAKWNTPSDLNIELLTNVEGFYEIYDTRGYEFDNYVNSSNRSIQIHNPEMINPVLLHVTYTEKYFSTDSIPIHIIPLPPNTNDSFYLSIRPTQYDIRDARINYNIIKYANLYLKTDEYDSWKNQTIIIYENNVPIGKGTIGNDGKVVIEIRDLEIGECKTYFIEKIDR
jgi:hypothetical protein